MTIRLCPHCNKKFSVAYGTSDFEHECNSNKEVLDFEDVPKIGNFTDADGTTGTVNKSIVQVAGTANRLQGTDAFYEENAHQGGLTSRGNNVDTHRQRRYVRHIDLK